MCFMGEGATNIGGFHEALSLAGLWKLPLVAVVENNTYSMGTPLSRTSPVEDITSKAAGYGMAADRFDGHEVLVVKERLAKAVERARTGGGPTLIEIMTYRFRGHSMSDPGKYRTKEELEERKKNDPVLLARKRLTDDGVSEKEIAAVDAEVEAEIADAVDFAEKAEPAREEVMWKSVYAPAST